ncbi:protein-L-isoaspartate(D-aspartate) O-methyltransferase [Desulfosediminicola ganghwensis]|uniref:protein-L-isoaspartate(D-aspartate) O-methyltransferase n=1 Tax=Desulfosediminicola ganghwensis TaxID=2569540 RepID=UPI0010AB553D|nr:protein-L-isoaspartate(D-aspartate) O-methyltransferase [Desulfosediminicola ganghwensis]
MHRADIQEMLRIIEVETRMTRMLTGRSALRSEVMDAMASVPRHQFVASDLRPYAYSNGPLPIGNGQTISQPFIVALMTDLLCPEPDDVMLEVGAGCGYQAAVLSLLIHQLYTIEIIPSLASDAAQRLKKLGYHNVEVCQGDGYHGWPEHAPFDGIIVTAAASHIPNPLQEQLRPGGKLVIPVGLPYHTQQLMVLKKESDRSFIQNDILSVAFVPLTGLGHDRENDSSRKKR